MSEPARSVSLDPQSSERVDLPLFLPSPLAERWHAEGRDADADTQRAVLMSLSRLLGALTTYLPRHLLRELLRHPLPGRTHGEFLSSTVLFADISGFTAMSERLSALGREGAETLTAVVNDFFTRMSNIAAQYDGDLVIFGGDAMLLLFDGVDHALRACHTAWRMQQAMAERFAEVKTAQGTFQLRMAAGLGSGQVFATALGSTDSMHYTLMGPALAAMGHAEALAGGGRIILDKTTQALAGAVSVQAEGESGYARLIAEPTASYNRPDPTHTSLPPIRSRSQIDWLAERIAAIVPFLPKDLLPRLLPNPLALLEGEHRPVTVVFVDFRDADALIDRLAAGGPDAITPRLNAAFDAARKVVTRYEGVVNKISAGPAGPHIIALFGAPTSHEDDPERAVRAALEMQAVLHEAGLPGVHPARIGVNTGFVYAANVGSSVRREYTVMGDQVNLAARLMTAAQPGEVLVSASTAGHVEHIFDLNEREPVRVKGKAQPQRNFLVRSVHRRSAARPSATSGELLGRAGEVALGVERIVATRRGQGQIVALSGETGAGKSRLAEALAQRAEAEGFELIGGTCVSYSGTIPYSVWLEPLRELLDLTSSESDAERRAKLQAALAAIGRGDDAPIVGDIVDVPLADTTWTAGLDAQAKQRRLFDAVVELIRHRAARRPLLWLVDDAHWIDPASLDLLNHLARHIEDSAIVLLVAYRPEGKWRGWEGLSNAVEITLPLLDRAAIEALIADLLGLEERRLPLAVQTMLERMAAGVLNVAATDTVAFERYWGNPFFAQERVRALIEAGALARDAAGQWQVTRPIESIEMPDTIHGVILSRIDRLPEPARRVLQVASVIGRTVDLTLLQAVYDAPGESFDSLRRHLQALGDLGLAPVEPDSDRARYTFRYVTTQEVAYDSLRYERRRELHRRIGEQIEAQPGLVEDATGVLTHHYYEGQAWDKTLRYALEAGRRAQQKYANAAAAGAYRRALQAAESLSPPRAEEQLAAHEALGDVLLITGEYDEALQHCEHARLLAAGDSRRLADLCRKTAEVHERRSEYDESFTWLNQGLAYAAPSSLEAARIYLMGAGVFLRQGKQDFTVEWCEKSLNISRALTEDAARRAEAHAQYLLAGIYYKRGELERAIEAAQQAATIYLLAGDMLGQSQALNTLASAHFDKGDFTQATAYYQQGLHIKEQIGDVAGQAMITLNLGGIFLEKGETSSARQMYERSLRIWRELRNMYAVALLFNNLAATAIEEGELGQAADHLVKSEKLFDEIGSEDFKAELLRHRAELSLGRGLIAEALAWAQKAIDTAETGQEKLEIGLARRVLGKVYLAQDDLIRADRELQASLDILENLDSRVRAANTRLALAQLRRRQGQLEEAHRLIAEAIEVYEAAGAEPLIGRAQAELRST